MKLLILILLTLTIVKTEEEEKFTFQAEVSRLLDIIINSLYSQKEIFIREAISNASDALDKIRFLAVEKPEALSTEPDLKIKISIDNSAESKKIIIQDHGVGMTKQDLINNLGTIARSGTTQFLDIISKGENLNLIGQFGVGFYSYFLVANKVTVITKHNDDDQYVWESSAGSSFTIKKEIADPELKRGSKIILHLKSDAAEFSEPEKLKTLTKKYSEFINFPIFLHLEKEVSKEVEVEEEQEESSDKVDEDKSTEEKLKEDDVTKEGEEKKDEEIKIEDEKKEKKKKVVKEKVWEWERVNDTKAIWLRSPEDIEDEEYIKFYKSISKDYEDPLTWVHFKTEGDYEFTALLFIPKKAPFDMFNNNNDKKSALKLYVRRVLINEEFEELLPKYLSFIKGVVDSNDLPLNVSRETLQQMRILKTIKKKLVNKLLDKLSKLSLGKSNDDNDEPTDDLNEEELKQFEEKKKERTEKRIEKYNSFWNEFGKNLKLGVIDGEQTNKQKLSKILRFYSTNNIEKLTSLEDYVSRKKESQEGIYFLAGEKKEDIIKNPLIKGLSKRKYEVLVLNDPIDEYVIQNLTEFDKIKFINISKGDFKFPEDEEEKDMIKKLNKYYQPLIDWLKSILEKKIETVRVSLKMDKEPMIILAGSQGYSPQMEKVARAQALGGGADKLAYLDNMKKIIEINPYHPFNKEILERVKNSHDKETEESAKLLFYVSLISSGYALNEVEEFSSSFYHVMSDSLGIPRDQSPVKLDLEEVEDDDETKEENNEEKTEETNKQENSENTNSQENSEEPVKVDYNTGENEEVVNTNEEPKKDL